MTKPTKPKKPRKNDPAPTTIVTVSKLLVFNNNSNKYELIDEISHPNIFRFSTRTVDDNGEEIFEINNELYPNWNELGDNRYEESFEILSYNQHQRIYKECTIPSDDFEVENIHNEDGYYIHSIVKYKAIDADYESKLAKYNNRFVEYDQKLAEYQQNLKKYEDFKKLQKKRKLEQALKIL